MLKFNYGETFELMQAYSKLGNKEQKIIEYLTTMEVYKGSYTELSKELNIDCSNLRKCLIYLDSIGIVCIERKETKNKKEQINQKMNLCFLIDGWMEVLIRQYKNNHIHSSIAKKNEVIEYYKKIENVIL